jgi:predicted permease
LRKSPGFAAVATLSLALGIGANTTIFSVLNAVLLRLLPVPAPEQLVLLSTSNQSFSYPVYRQLRDRAQSLQLIAFRTLPMSLSVNGATERITGEIVSGNYFSTLGVRVSVGTAIEVDDDRKPGSGGPRGPVAVLSEGLWRRRFGGDPAVIGRTVNLNGQPFTVTGVAARGFTGTDVGQAADVFAPMMMESTLNPGNANALEAPRNVWLRIMGRLRPHTAIAQAESELSVLLHQFNQDLLSRMGQVSPARRRGLLEQRVTLLPGGAGLSGLRKRFSRPLFILMSVVGLVLLIACANVANLLLARATGRRREIAVRLALGATRGRLVSQLMIESLILATIGAGAGVLLSRWMRDLLLRFLPQAEGLVVNLDGQVLAFTLLLAAATGLLFGLAPAFEATRPALIPGLKGERAESGGFGFHLRQGLVVLQVAVSLLLLIGAGLFVRSLQNIESIDPGFARENILLASVDPALNGYKPEQTKLFFESLLDRVKSLPNVRSASLADCDPLGNHTGTNVYVQGYQPRADEPRNSPSITVIAPGYFGTMGISLLAGRDIGAQDGRDTPKVALINETFAKHYFPGTNPVGGRVGFDLDKYDMEIVGVVRDSKYGNLREPSTRMIYTAVAQSRLWGSMILHARAAGSPASLVSMVREQVRAIDKDLPVFNVYTVEERVSRSLSQEKLMATLSGLFGGLALALAAVGLYGVMSYAVGQRTREIGIRMALGAGRGVILKRVLWEAGAMTLAGVLLGLPVAWALARLVSSMLYGLRPTDPVATGGAVAALALAALLAAWVPARRATRVDPLVALRYE